MVSISLRCPSSLLRSGVLPALVWTGEGVVSLRVDGFTFAGDLSLVRLEKLLDVCLGVEVLVGWWGCRPPSLGPNLGWVRWLEVLVLFLLLGLRGRQGRWWRILPSPDGF